MFSQTITCLINESRRCLQSSPWLHPSLLNTRLDIFYFSCLLKLNQHKREHLRILPKYLQSLHQPHHVLRDMLPIKRQVTEVDPQKPIRNWYQLEVEFTALDQEVQWLGKICVKKCIKQLQIPFWQRGEVGLNQPGRSSIASGWLAPKRVFFLLKMY